MGRLVSRRGGGGAGGDGMDVIDPHGMGDVLETALAQVLEIQAELAHRVLADAVGDADSPCDRQRLQPGGDVDTVADEVLALHDHFALVQADAEGHLLGRGAVRAEGGQPLLDEDGRAQGEHDAGEFSQQPVAEFLEHPAAEHLHAGVDHVAACCVQPRQGAGLVLTEHAGESDDVGHENGGQSAFWFVCVH